MLPVEYPLPEIVRKTMIACSRLHSTRDSRSTKWNKNGGWAPGHQTGPSPDPDVDPGIFGTRLGDRAGTKRCIAGSGSRICPDSVDSRPASPGTQARTAGTGQEMEASPLQIKYIRQW